MDRLLQHNNQIAVATAIRPTPASPAAVAVDTVTVFAAGYTSVGSAIVLAASAIKSRSWLGNLEALRVNIALGAFVSLGLAVWVLYETFVH